MTFLLIVDPTRNKMRSILTKNIWEGALYYRDLGSARMELISCSRSVQVRQMNGSIYGRKAALWMKPSGKIWKVVTTDV